MEAINTEIKKIHDTDKISITTRIPAELAREMRIISAKSGRSLEDHYTDAIRQYANEQAFEEIRPKKFPGKVRGG